MKHALLLILTFFSIATRSKATDWRMIRGYVRDGQTQEALISATITLKSGAGCTTDEKGYFSLPAPTGLTQVTCSYVGYTPITVEILLRSDTLLNLQLRHGIKIDEVMVFGTSRRLQTPQTSMNRIDISMVKSLPAFMGVPDLLKALQALPGVTMGTEGVGGYYVRGGNSDQNLVLWNGAPIYNPYHLYGFFSVFNSEAINDAQIYKGGIPARYGGRLSSVLDLTMRDGDAQRHHAGASIGLASSNFLVEGPIVKNRVTYIVTGRRSMVDLVFGQLPNGVFKGSSFMGGADYKFFDITAKICFHKSERSSWHLTYYQGLDRSGNSDRVESNKEGDSPFVHTTYEGVDWGNRMASIRWSGIIWQGVKADLSLYNSYYQYVISKQSVLTTQTGAESLVRNINSGMQSHINDYGANLNLEYHKDAHRLKLGFQAVRHSIEPNMKSRTTFSDGGANSSILFSDSLPKPQATRYEGVIYLEDEIALSDCFKVSAGLRLAAYPVPKKFRLSLEPRITLSYLPARYFSTKLSYMRITQPLHVVTSYSAGLPSDIWVPSTAKFAPEYSNQLVLGAYIALPHWEFSVEGFWKTMGNLVSFDLVSRTLSDLADWDELLVSGRGDAHGMEVGTTLRFAKTNLSVSYTLSRTTRQFDALNQGRKFPFRYDRRHNLNVSLNQKLGRNWEMGVTWVYTTGSAITLPDQYTPSGISISEWNLGGNITSASALNNYRLPSYHRLDGCISYLRKVKWGEMGFSFGAYNAYNRKNPYYLRSVGLGFEPKYLLPIVPYLSCSFKF